MSFNRYKFDKNSPGDFERYSSYRSRLADESNHRRNRQWTLFTLAITALLAVLAGAVTLQTTGHQLPIRYAWLVAAIGMGFGCVCGFVIWRDAQVAERYTEECAEVDRIFDLNFEDGYQKPSTLLRLHTFLLVAAAAISVAIGFTLALGSQSPARATDASAVLPSKK